MTLRYVPIVARTPQELADKVNKELEAGSELHGTMTSSPTRGEFVQIILQKAAPVRKKKAAPKAA